MSDFVSNWNNELLTRPFGPLGIIAMPGCEEAAQKINEYLMKWYEQQEALEDMEKKLPEIKKILRRIYAELGLKAKI